MVTLNPTYHSSDGKWLKYIGFSLLVNLLIISAVNISTVDSDIVSVSSLKVNLMSLAAPSKPVVKEPTEQKKQVVKQKIVTEKFASQKVLATLEPAANNEVEKVVEETPAQALPTSNGVGYDKSTIIHAAKFRKQTPPVYPKRALELNQQGMVTLHAEILPTGQPRKLKIAQSSGHRLLDNAALAAVKKWEFEPTEMNGSFVTSWVSVPVKFVIQ